MIITVKDNRFMLSIAKIQKADSSYYTHATPSAGSQLPYYEKDGTWDGALSDLLGLREKTVVKKDLDNIWAGNVDLSNDFPGVRHSRIKNAAFDFTFSAPKSVSILFGLTEDEISSRIAESHERSVKTAFSYLERECSYVRRTEHKIQTKKPAKGLLSAQFLHRTSRANDPHLHTHLTIANLSTEGSGKWSALATRILYGHIRNAGLLYHWNLRFDLSKSLGVSFTDSRPYADLIGLDRKIILSFSKRQQQMTDELAFLDLATPQAKKIALYKSRPPKDFSTPYLQLQEKWKEEAYGLGISNRKLHSLLHSQKHFFSLANGENNELSDTSKLLDNNNVSLNRENTTANLLKGSYANDQEGRDEAKIDTNQISDLTSSAKKHVAEHGRILSDFQLTFTRKTLLTSCLLHVNDQLAPKDIENGIDQFLSSREVISLNEDSHTKNIYRQVFSPDNKSYDRTNPRGHLDLGQENTDHFVDTFSSELEKSGRPEKEKVYMHQKNLVILSKIAAIQRKNHKNQDINITGRTELSLPTGVAAPVDGSIDSFDPYDTQKTDPGSLDNKIQGNEVFPRERKIILTYSKNRAHLISAITGEETLSLQELLYKCKLESERENKLYCVLNGYIRKNGIIGGEVGQKIHLDYNSKNFDRIMAQFEEKLSSSLSSFLNHKEVTYELSVNPIPLILKNILDQGITSQQINFTQKIDLASLIKEHQKENVNFSEKKQIPESIIKESAGEIVKSSLDLELNRPVSNTAAITTGSHPGHFTYITDRKKKVILVEEKKYFLDELKSNLSKLQNNYDHIIVVADDCLELKTQKFQRKALAEELERSETNRYLSFGGKTDNDYLHIHRYRLKGSRNRSICPQNNYCFSLPQKQYFSPVITQRRTHPKGNLMILNPGEAEKLIARRRKTLDWSVGITHSDLKKTDRDLLANRSFQQRNSDEGTAYRSESICLFTIGIPAKIPPGFEKDDHVHILVKPKFIPENDIERYLEDLCGKSNGLQKERFREKTGNQADYRISPQVNTPYRQSKNNLRNYQPALNKTDVYQNEHRRNKKRYLDNQNMTGVIEERSDFSAEKKHDGVDHKSHDLDKRQIGKTSNYKLRESFEISL